VNFFKAVLLTFLISLLIRLEKMSRRVRLPVNLSVFSI
jgi:hypothetical protein